jgi:hypothetical protein
MVDETTLAKAKDPVDATRDLIAERSEKLNKKSARKLFETAYDQRGKLSDFDEDVREVIFDTAIEEGGEQNGRPLWGAAFNSYAALQNLIKDIRIPGEFKEGTGGQYAEEVLNARNRVSAVFALFRKHKDMSDEDARSILELAHVTYLAGLSSEARKALYNYAADRGVSKLEVANQYVSLAELASKVKRNLYPEA